MIDVKKLITGFLIIALAAVCSGLIFSFVNFSSPGVAANTAGGITIGANTGANTANAFLPTEAQVQETAAALAPGLASSSMYVSSSDPGNLTDVLATNFVNSIVSANPAGPTGTDANGNPTFNTPDASAIAENVAASTSTQALQIPDWDAEVAAIPVATIASNSSTITNYGNALNGILNSHLDAQFQSIIGSQTDLADASSAAYLESQVQGTLQDTASLKVPTLALAYQKSLLAELVYEKNMLQLYTLAQTDPVKASLIFDQEDAKFALVKQNLSSQDQSLQNESLSFEQAPSISHNNLALSFLTNTFGVPQAHAMLPVFDWTTWTALVTNHLSDISTQLEAIAKNTLLQILKNTLIAIVQQKVLAWVQGSGAPRFITNWGATLVDAAQTNAINAINSDINSGCVYSAFAPQVMVTLKAFYTPTNNSACANLFQAALGANSFQQFYNNFSNGGFLAFGASTLPSGNPYGTEFFEAQKTDVAYNNQQAATALQTQTSGGFKGDQVCDDGSDPNGNVTVCEDSNGAYEASSIGNDNGIVGNVCPTGEKAVTVPNGGLCADGSQPIVTTPSAVTGFAVDTAFKGTTQQIAAANDIAGLLNSVMSSLVLGLANSAVNAAGQLVNQTLSSANPSNITSGAATTPPAQIPLACNPSTQTIPSASAGSGSISGSTATSTSPATLSATGGTLDANDNPPIYYWSDTNGVTSTGSFFSDTFTVPGTYTVTLGDSTGDASTTCTVIQQ
jgi:hypothetical protein